MSLHLPRGYININVSFFQFSNGRYYVAKMLSCACAAFFSSLIFFCEVFANIKEVKLLARVFTVVYIFKQSTVALLLIIRVKV